MSNLTHTQKFVLSLLKQGRLVRQAGQSMWRFNKMIDRRVVVGYKELTDSQWEAYQWLLHNNFVLPPDNSGLVKVTA